jgi:hypothetical protein
VQSIRGAEANSNPARSIRGVKPILTQPFSLFFTRSTDLGPQMHACCLLRQATPVLALAQAPPSASTQATSSIHYKMSSYSICELCSDPGERVFLSTRELAGDGPYSHVRARRRREKQEEDGRRRGARWRTYSVGGTRPGRQSGAGLPPHLDRVGFGMVGWRRDWGRRETAGEKTT